MDFHSRAQIQLDTMSEVTEFVKAINSTGTIDKYVIENFDGTLKVSARSFLGVMYASAEFGADGLFLVNMTNDGDIPYSINRFRKLGE